MLLSLPVVLYFAIELPVVQTFIVHEVTGILSEKLHPAKVSIGSVHYKFFRRLAVDEIMVHDVKGDTLLYVKELSVSLTSFNISRKRLSVRDIRLSGGEFHLYTYRVSDGENSTNIKDVLANLQSNAPPDTTVKTPSEPWQIKLHNIELSDFRFTFQNKANPMENQRPDVVNFKDLDLSRIHIDMRDLRFAGDTLFFEIKDIRFKEKSGWQLQRLTAQSAYLCGTQIMLRDAEVIDNYSNLPMRHYSMSYDSFRDFNNYEDKVRMEADFDNAYFSFRTVGYMAKGFRVTSAFRLNGLAGGTVSNLRSDFLQIDSESGRTKLITKFRMKGLPEINETMIYVNVIRLTSQVDELTDLIQSFVPDTLPIKKLLHPLDDVHFTGSFTGFYNNFVTKGAMRTSLGGARFDLSFDLDNEPAGVRMKGDAQAYKLHLGKLMGASPTLGEISGAVKADAYIRPERHGGILLDATGKLSEFEFLGYRYQNISLTGAMEGDDFDGAVSINDPNLKMFFDGKIVEAAKTDTAFRRLLKFDAGIEYADLVALHLNKRDSASTLRADVKADYTMTNTLDGIGNIKISGIEYTGRGGLQNIGDIVIQSKYESAAYKTTLRSSFLDADYSGPKQIQGFVDRVVDLMVKRPLPALNAGGHELKKELPVSNYTFKAVFKTAGKVTDAILPGLYVAPGTEVTAKLTTQDSLNLLLKSKELTLNEYQLKKVTLLANNSPLRSYAMLVSGETSLGGFALRNVSTVLLADDNKVNARITYDNQTTPLNYGNLLASVDFSQEEITKNLVTDLHILPSKLVINDTLWNIGSSNIVFDDKITIKNFDVYNKQQSLNLQGALSKTIADTLTLNLRNFNIANVNYLTEKEGFHFNGIMSGKARVVDLYNSPRFFADISAKQVLINERPLGDLVIRSLWDNEEKLFRLKTYAEWDSLRTLDIIGTYAPGNKYLDMTTTFNAFQLSHIEPLLKGILSEVEGTVSGKARVHGPLKDLKTEGESLYANRVAATVDYLQTHYSFSTPVILTPTSFGFRNANVSDGVGGKATLSVLVHHDHFKDMQFDVAAYPRNLCVMNTSERDNELFYGQAFASGAALIKGKPGSIHFDINVKTERHTVLHIPAASSAQSANMNLLTFIQPHKDTIAEDADRVVVPLKETRTPVDMDLTLNVNVGPETEVQIELDKKAGEIIRSRGTGDIKIDVNPASGKFLLFGDYSVSEGDYLFTIQNFNIISKKFMISNGGRISFNGDLRKTYLDLSAVYRTQATLNTLISDTSSVAMRRPIDCTIGISGNMFSPSLKFHIDVKNLDAETQARVQSALNTEEKVTRQFLSLLAFGQFMPDQDANISSGLIFTAGTEMLSNQLNQMLTHLNVPFYVGFNYVPGTQGRTDSYVGSFGAQVWDNRVTINGNVGGGATQNISNDFDVELKLDDKGQLNFKVFTHSVDKYNDNIDNSQRYGVGIVYKEEFDTFPELFHRLFGKKKKQEPLPEKEPAAKPEEEQETSGN